MLGAIFLVAVVSAPVAGPPQLPPVAPGPDPTRPPAALAAAADPGGGPRYAFEVRDVQVEGLDWRAVLKGRARRLEWQAGVMVWAVSEETVRDLMAHVQKSVRSSVMQAPKAVAEAGQSARTLTGSTVQLVVDLERQGEGPAGREVGLAYQPILEQMHNGVDLAVSATPSPEGLIVGVNLDETSLQGVHTGSFEDAIDGPASPDDRPILGLFRRRGEGDDPAVARAGAMKLQASFQVPEVARSHVEGSWPLRPGESLLISLGARSSSEKWGRSVVIERLVLITAGPDSAAAGAGAGSPIAPAVMPEVLPVLGGYPPTPSPSPFSGEGPR